MQRSSTRLSCRQCRRYSCMHMSRPTSCPCCTHGVRNVLYRTICPRCEGAVDPAGQHAKNEIEIGICAMPVPLHRHLGLTASYCHKTILDHHPDVGLSKEMKKTAAAAAAAAPPPPPPPEQGGGERRSGTGEPYVGVIFSPSMRVTVDRDLDQSIRRRFFVWMREGNHPPPLSPLSRLPSKSHDGPVNGITGPAETMQGLFSPTHGTAARRRLINIHRGPISLLCHGPDHDHDYGTTEERFSSAAHGVATA